jgi:hypothetical protein
MKEQRRQHAAADATEGAWRAENQEQIDAWVPELVEQRRLNEERRLKEVEDNRVREEL